LRYKELGNLYTYKSEHNPNLNFGIQSASQVGHFRKLHMYSQQLRPVQASKKDFSFKPHDGAGSVTGLPRRRDRRSTDFAPQ
jgi:hypothetical protein